MSLYSDLQARKHTLHQQHEAFVWEAFQASLAFIEKIRTAFGASRERFDVLKSDGPPGFVCDSSYITSFELRFPEDSRYRYQLVAQKRAGTSPSWVGAVVTLFEGDGHVVGSCPSATFALDDPDAPTQAANYIAESLRGQFDRQYAPVVERDAEMQGGALSGDEK